MPKIIPTMKKLFLPNFAILTNLWNTEYGSIWKHVMVLTGCDSHRGFDGTTFMQILSCETVPFIQKSSMSLNKQVLWLNK